MDQDAPLFLIAGAPASGKSSAARALAATYARSIHIDVDRLREMVIGGVIHPSLEWSDALVEQLGLARGAAVEMARRYHAAGFAVVIDDFWDPVSHLQEYDRLDEIAPARRVLLYPDPDKAHRQNLQRAGAGEAQAYIDAGIRQVYAALQAQAAALPAAGWLLIDSTHDTIAETVARLRAAA